MKTFQAFSAIILLLGLPVLLGSGCSSGNHEPVAALCTANANGPGDHPFAAYTNPKGRPVGEPCAFDNQCATNRCSGDAIAGTCGECVTIRALGETCTGPHQSCSISAVCQDGICKSLRKVEGDACALGPKGDDREECDVELFCARTGGYDESGTCTRLTPRGQCCGEELIRCALGTECNRETLTCEIPIPGACMYGYYCVGENACGADLVCHPGTLPENAPCGIVNGEFVENACSPGLICGSSNYPNGGNPNPTTCVPLPGKGEPCIQNYCAEGLFCWHSLVDDRITACELPRNEGEECNVFTYYKVPCAQGLECRGNTCRPACQ